MKITKILVPTDFSDNATEALKTAAELAYLNNAELHLLHAFGLPDRFYNDEAQNYLRKIATDLKEENEVKLSELAEDLLNELSYSNITTKVFAQNLSLTESVEDYVSKNKVDFIVMGTKGANNVEDMVFGSNTAKVIEMSLCPVLSVPQGGKVVFKNMVHAVDVDNVSMENIQFLAELAKSHNGNITLLNVANEITSEIAEKFSVFEDRVRSEINYENLHFKLFQGTDVFESIDAFVKATEADLLSTSRKERTGFFARLFDSSLSETIALYSDVSLLSLKLKK